MINEDKVALMTRMASYESGRGKKDIAVLNYFRGDYIGFRVLKSVIAATIAFCLIFAVYVFYNFEKLMQEIYEMDLMAFGKNIIVLYLCTVGAYGVISYIVYAVKYSRAKKNLKVYYGNLKKLSSMYDR
ncbi:MAG: hypothetical protein IKY23_00755 [Lachnospiraceae bacterium]|jgi:hypothetical protein|nr:hypothetical protein [Lachnospiraceae bacterium]